MGEPRTDGPEHRSRHYDRSERMDLPSARHKTEKPRGIFRSNRGMMILLIDVAAILLIVVVLRALGLLDPSTGSIADRGVRLSATEVAAEVLVSLAIEPGPDGPTPPGRVFVRFYFEGREEDFLARSAALGAERIEVETILADRGSRSRVIAEVTVGAESVRLRASIGGSGGR